MMKKIVCVMMALVMMLAAMTVAVAFQHGHDLYTFRKTAADIANIMRKCVQTDHRFRPSCDFFHGNPHFSGESDVFYYIIPKKSMMWGFGGMYTTGQKNCCSFRCSSLQSI